MNRKFATVAAVLSLSLILGFAKPAQAQDPGFCLPTEAVLREIAISRPEAAIEVFNQMEALAFLKRIEEIEQFTIAEQFKRAPGLILVGGPNDKVILMGFIMADSICGPVHLPIELVTQILGNWPTV